MTVDAEGVVAQPNVQERELVLFNIGMRNFPLYLKPSTIAPLCTLMQQEVSRINGSIESLQILYIIQKIV